MSGRIVIRRVLADLRGPRWVSKPLTAHLTDARQFLMLWLFTWVMRRQIFSCTEIYAVFVRPGFSCVAQVSCTILLCSTSVSFFIISLIKSMMSLGHFDGKYTDSLMLISSSRDVRIGFLIATRISFIIHFIHFLSYLLCVVNAP